MFTAEDTGEQGYLRCRDCGITMEERKAGHPGNKDGSNFTWIADHSWRCKNCGYQGGLKRLVLDQEVHRPKDHVIGEDSDKKGDTNAE